MTIHVALNHTSHYRYDRWVKLGPQIVRLRPAPHSRNKIISYSLKVEPDVHFVNWLQDPFANYQARLVFPEPTQVFKITVDLVVEMAVFNPFDFFLEPRAENYPISYSKELGAELTPYLACDPLTPLLSQYLKGIDHTPCRTIDFLVKLNQQVHRSVRYLIRLEPGVQTPEETLSLGSGSCRDSAWLLVQLLRRCGMAARFVSGYLIQLKADVKAIDGPSGTEVDFTDLHAWCEVYLPGAGWVGLDATSGLLTGEGHIPLACTPQPSGASPIEGLVDEAEVEFEHHMSVSRVLETPRVTLPYPDNQWREILALGDRVDEQLQREDTRLTMGGEPTFVATTDRDAPEWNTDALGPTKRKYATELVQRLRDEYGQGGFLHFGQGKWYPGEQLPRWALSICWRADGVATWQNPDLFAKESEPSFYTSEDAKAFLHDLTLELGLPLTHIQTGYEDTIYYLWRERRLPLNVDPFDSRLDDEMERARLLRVFEQKLDSEIGYLLPIQVNPLYASRAPSNPSPVARWLSSPWFLRDERLYLIPGDSPMGYRLPLDSLPWVKSEDYPYHHELDPFAPRAPLSAPELKFQSPLETHAPTSKSSWEGAFEGIKNKFNEWTSWGLGSKGEAVPSKSSETTSSVHSHAHPPTASPLAAPARHESAPWIVRTALCVEARDPRRANGPKGERVGEKYGVIYVFMPPLAELEDYLALLQAVEKTAQKRGVRIVLEGYPPPRDPRLKILQVTPDPGVIEVNIHPAHSWKELVSHTEFLYDAAHWCGLSAEKFMTDGKHTGTGGGNHVVLGGATPADSPFLRQPELLASLILFWHNHPSLSYLFSGLFIGPTSQAPRVDEARNDQVYELEIAIKEIYRQRQHYQAAMPPWLVDRTLRNILIDVTGNTHRSEFCIDKMYSPDSATGRLGLLELRAFEMPPHARMSIVQQLLIRALVARFWNTPYLAPVTRWGTELHDRFLLPSFIHQDFQDVLDEMRLAGYPFDPAWFEPHFEFRFPQIGELTHAGMVMTLRNALEPWHVMGEEGSSGGTARYVDSSLERIEVHIKGFNPSRYTLTVNQRPLPMHPTGVSTEFVAGVRFKAWSPPSSLHPSIASHAPLTFDLYDTWSKRAVAGVQYCVTHPGGLNYTNYPVNAYEAQSRRVSRFMQMGHTPGAWPVPPASIELPLNQEFPLTLDLRRV
jgi:uncharacterized protein (DUF2126 family)